MEEYLKKSDVIRAINGEYPEPRYPSWFAGIVRDMPAEDIDERGMGQWELYIGEDGIEVECGVCGQTYDGSGVSSELADYYHYCPRCGAKLSW